MQCLALAGFEPRYTVPRFGQPTCTSQYTSKKEVYHISNPDRASCSFMLSWFCLQINVARNSHTILPSFLPCFGDLHKLLEVSTGKVLASFPKARKKFPDIMGYAAPPPRW